MGNFLRRLRRALSLPDQVAAYLGALMARVVRVALLGSLPVVGLSLWFDWCTLRTLGAFAVSFWVHWLARPTGGA